MGKVKQSLRSEVVTKRTYNRPLYGDKFESWSQTVDRVIEHQGWLWSRASKQGQYGKAEYAELQKLKQLMLDRKVLPSGRTLWLGGTDVSKRREASQFNCSFLRVETVHDIVDAYWLLLQGCGVGFEPVVGTLNGFTRPVEFEVIRSAKTDPKDKGVEGTTDKVYTDNGGYTWHITVGDSAEAWAKLPGKILAQKKQLKKIILDTSEIRPAGVRLKSYGWISSGDELLVKAMEAIVRILNIRNGQLLRRLDIMDIMNWLGSTLSSRRSAEITLVPYGDPEWIDFARAKENYWEINPQRGQSNNSVVFYHKPSREELSDLFGLMVEAGGSEPGFINGAAAVKRAPWFKGVNPCAEILLGNKSFCNLSEINLAAFNGDWDGLCEAVRLIARANYRQTCVNLDDGVLQRSWHELNEFLRLTGVGLTGIVRWEYLGDGTRLAALRKVAQLAVHNMADELGLPRSRNVTTVKPSGTLSKVMDTTEGLHKPLGRYIFNNIKFSIHDPLVGKCRDAGYRVFDDPNDTTAVLVTFPVEWSDVAFDVVDRDGKQLHVNLESAVDQLDRYKWLMDNYVDHNASITVSYDVSEIPDIVDWLQTNWDTYVGVSFMLRADPTKTARDLGFAYLPQEVVTKDAYDEYVSKLGKLKVTGASVELKDDECSTGACPIR
jgi:adenosylcobalamin-dependent ribonucleoside-triphosphate reductase